MDKTDIQILNILQSNSRTTMKEIGNEVTMTSPAVAERVRRMEEKGVIEGYHVDINQLKMGKTIIAFVSVDVNPKMRDGFNDFCDKNSLIKEHYHILGPYNAMLKVAAEDSEQLAALLSNIQIFGVSQTSVILSTIFKHKPEE